MTRITVRDALTALHVAEKQLAESVAQTYTPGTWISFAHGAVEREASVINTAGDRVHVRSKCGREYWIHAARIM